MSEPKTTPLEFDKENLSRKITAETDIETGEQVFKSEYDTSHKNITLVIIDFVTTIADKPHTKLEPLHYSVKTNPINNLFKDTTDTTTQVTFEYEGYKITITANGTIEATTPIEYTIATTPNENTEHH